MLKQNRYLPYNNDTLYKYCLRYRIGNGTDIYDMRSKRIFF